MSNRERLEENNEKLNSLIELIKNKTNPTKPTGKYSLFIVAFNGDIILDGRANEGDVVTLPTPPTYDRLTFDHWATELELIDNSFVMPAHNVCIGAVYVPTSGLTELDFVIDDKITTGPVTLNMTGTKDWGDGTIDQETTHTYAKNGEYLVTCDGARASNDNNLIPVDNFYCKNARLSPNLTWTGKCFDGARGLESVAVRQISSAGNGYGGFFRNCPRLKCVVFGVGSTRIQYNDLNDCYSLRYIIAPTLTSVGSQNLNITNSYGVQKIYIPNSRDTFVVGTYNTILNEYYFSKVTSLTSSHQIAGGMKYIKIPETVTKMSGNAISFTRSPNLEIVDLSDFTTVLTLSSTITESTITKSGVKFVVPDALYDEWIVATNWSAIAFRIVKRSEVII